MVLGAQAVERRLYTLKSLYVAFLGVEEACQRPQDLNRGGLFDRADIGPGLIGEGDPLSHCWACRSSSAVRPAGSWPSSPSRSW